jgi:hypothetical protein
MTVNDIAKKVNTSGSSKVRPNASRKYATKVK